MQNPISLLAWIVIAGVSLSEGCSSNTERVSRSESSGSPSGSRSTTAQKSSRAAPGSGATVTAQGLQWEVPAGFTKDTPSNPMRIAQYRIASDQEGIKDGELAVFFFGTGSGGGTQANIERWAGQFKQPDGSDPMKKARIDRFSLSGGLTVTTIELAGRYESGMMGGVSYNEPGWKLLGAVVEGEGGPWFFKAVGPEPVMDRAHPALQKLYRGLRLPSS